MSFMVVKCDWCGEEYTFGMVGREIIGSGHFCTAVVDCDAADCTRPGVYRVLAEPERREFACSAHLAGRIIVGCQPGNTPLPAPDSRQED